MRKLKVIAGFAIIGLVISCNNSLKQEYTEESATPASLKNEPVSDSVFSTLEAVKYEELTTTIHFGEFTLDIQNFSTFDENDLPAISQTDTLTINADIGENLSRSSLVISEELTDVKIEQRYETSVTIMDEGPHCDMVDWKHYTSEWKVLKSETDNIFKCADYTEKEQEKFPEVSLQEFREAIKKHCGEPGIEHIKSPVDYPSGVGISRIYLKISGTQKSTGKFIVKYLIFEIPMGC
jgi:hypothetical protein